MKNRIGFHFGSGATAAGYGEYVRELDDAGIPAVVMSVGGEGLGDIIAQWDAGSTVDHVAVVRCLSHNDVPLYDYPIDTAVTDWLDRYIPTIGQDVIQYHERIITKHGNELDKNKIQWLADFYEALHPALLQRMGWQNHRICVFNFASGEPEPEQWESVLPFLRMAGENPDKFVIGIHEYSYNTDDIFDGYNWKVGRFQHLYSICDRHGIPRPTIAIHEFGWQATEMPDRDIALDQLQLAMEMYAWEAGEKFLGAGIWTLQEWQDSDINLKVQELIPFVRDMTLQNEYETQEFPPLPPPPTKPSPKVVVVKLPQEPARDLWATAGLWAYDNYKRTQTASADDAITLLQSGNNESYALIVNPNDFPSQKNFAAVLEELGHKWQPLYLQGQNPPPPPTIPPLMHGDVVIDISNAQGDIDLDRILDTGIVKRVIIRVSSGKRWNSTDENGIDLRYWNNVGKAIARGIPTECYCFVDILDPIDEQINRFYTAVRQAMSLGMLVDAVAMDFEGEFTIQTENGIREFATLFHDQNTICPNTAVYSGAWWWNRKVSPYSTWPHDLGLQQWCAYYVPGDPLLAFPPTSTWFAKLNGFEDSDVRYWQFTSKGGLLVNHIRKELDLNYYLELESSPPPSQDVVNVLPFVRGTDRVQFDLEYAQGTQTTQVRHYPTRFIYVKGEPGQYECFFVAPYNGVDWIWRAEDTSESLTRFYAHYLSQGSAIGAPWVPVNMEVGRWYETSKFVQHYDKILSPNGQWYGGCTPANNGNVTDRIRLISLPYNRTYQSGRTLHVITLEWSGGEQYDYCTDFGNVGFRDVTRDFWFMNGPLLGRQDKTYIKPVCINVGW